jgi:hypothetical protein
MDNLGREEELRLHIRERLLDYALAHLTRDFIAFTENAVIEVDCLHNPIGLIMNHIIISFSRNPLSRSPLLIRIHLHCPQTHSNL